jgi:serine/threonine protein kinase
MALIFFILGWITVRGRSRFTWVEGSFRGVSRVPGKASTRLVIGQIVGHYRIESKLGEGGMGIVYRALDVHLDPPVAIKVLRPDAVADPERRRRFVREARAASALNHPNIVTIPR